MDGKHVRVVASVINSWVACERCGSTRSLRGISDSERVVKVESFSDGHARCRSEGIPASEWLAKQVRGFDTGTH